MDASGSAAVATPAQGTREHAAALLTELLSLADKGKKKFKRLETLLKEAASSAPSDWFMHVPKCFDESLDIQLTERKIKRESFMVWTQGVNFSFDEGDMFYDASEGYERWSTALKHVNLAVQVNTGISAQTLDDGGRLTGNVRFSILVPAADRSCLAKAGDHSMSQDDFVRFLISGPTGVLKEQIDAFTARENGGSQ